MKRLLLTLPLLSALIGCAAMDGFGGQGEICFQTSDCFAGQQCSFGQCTWIPSFEFDLEVTPLPSSGYLFQPVENIDPSVAEPLAVQVAEPLLLTLESPVSASARFTASDGLRRPRSFESTLELATGEAIARSELKLMAGIRDGSSGALTPVAYDLTAEPSRTTCCDGVGDCTAPVRQSGVVPTADSTFVLPLDPTTQPVILTGQVLVSEANWTPVENLQVQVFGPETGVRSLASQTDVDGHFCLAVVPPPSGSRHQMVLRLGPSESRPTLEVAGIEIGADDVDLGAFFTGDHGTPVTITGNTVLGPDQEPVQGVQVSYLGAVEPDGVFRQVAVTDELGRYSVRLLAGLYTVELLSPEDSLLSSTVVEAYEVSADPATSPVPLEVALGTRPVLLGAVQDGSSQFPVEDVEVVAERTDPTGDVSAPLTFRTRTDVDGLYRLPVDPGSYQLHFRTQSGSGLPWSVGHGVVVEPASDRSLETVQLEAPVVFAGTVLGERGSGPTEALGGSQVEILGRTRNGRDFVVGSAWADEAGVFEALLPQSLSGSLEPGP